MGPRQQYGMLLLFAAGAVALAVSLHLIGRWMGTTHAESGKDVPIAGGTLDPKPVWVCC